MLLYDHRDHKDYKDGESRTATLTFMTQLSDPHCWGHVPYEVSVWGGTSMLLYVHRDHKDYKDGESRTDTLTFTDTDLEL